MGRRSKISDRLAAVRVEFSWHVIVATLVINTLGLALPLVILQVYDRIIPHQAVASLAILCAGLVGVVTLEFLLRLSRASLLAWAGNRYEHRLRIAAVEHAFRCDLPEFEKTAAGTHLERLAAVEKLRELRSGEASLLLLDLPFFFVYLAVIALMSPFLAATALLMIGFAWLAISRSGRRLRDMSHDRSVLDGRRFSFIFEVLRAVESVKCLALEHFMQRRYERLSAHSARLGHDLAVESLQASGTAAVVQQLMVIVVASAGAVLVVSSQITSGALAAAILLAPRMLQPVLGFQAFLNRRDKADQWQQDLDALFRLAAPTLSGADPGRFESLRLTGGGLQSQAGQVILEGVDLDVRVGEIVAVTGASGSGKSTLMWALAGITDLSQGRLLINDRDIATLDRSAFRAQVGLLTQTTDLHFGTILDNLTLYEPERNYDEAMALCAQLGLDRFFSERPDGLMAQVGGSAESGLPLAVGRRITIVRALVGRPRLILLDEANSVLDRESDIQLLDLLLARRAEAAIVMVTHRPSYLRHADRCLDMRDRRCAAGHEAVPVAAPKMQLAL